MAIGNASAFAPDAAKAEESAKQIFKLIDLVPQVDAESEEGTKLDKVLLCGLINWSIWGGKAKGFHNAIV